MEDFDQMKRLGASLILLVVAILCVASITKPQNAVTYDSGHNPKAPLRVILLGTGNPRPAMSRFGPSILVVAGGRQFLFDCGRGVTQRIYQLGIPFNDVDALFLTHLHSDHTVGIPDLWLTGWVMGRTVPLRVWGPDGTASMAANLEQAYAFDVHIRRDVDEKLVPNGAVIQAHDVAPGIVFDAVGVRITAFTVDHGPVKPAYGYRVDFQGHSVVLSGDTRPSENLVRAAQGTDVLIHEVIDVDAYQTADGVYSPERKRKVIAHHTTPAEAAGIFAQVHPKLAIFSHIVPVDAPNVIAQTRKTYSGRVELGEDLMTIDIGDEVKVHRPNH